MLDYRDPVICRQGNLNIAAYVHDVPRDLCWRDPSLAQAGSVAAVELRVFNGAMVDYGCVVLARATDVDGLEPAEPRPRAGVVLDPKELADSFPTRELAEAEDELRRIDPLAVMIGGAYSYLETSPHSFRVAASVCATLLRSPDLLQDESALVATIRSAIAESHDLLRAAGR